MELITEEQAVTFGLTLKDSLDSLAKTSEIEKLHGDTVASLHRIAALQKFRQNLSSDVAKALILSGAGVDYEVAESDKFKIPDAIKLQGAVSAMCKGYLLSDDAGPHFTVILGKGGLSLLIKEAGHRHKLRRRGCRNVDVKAAAMSMRPRPNAPGKFDMILNGEASCVVDGEVITVSRTGDFPIILPCYDTDGPDGHEAKARRRLLRDLWAKVSGEFEPIELSEVDDDEGRSVVVVEPVKAKIETKAKPPEDDARKVQKAGFDGWHKAAQTRVTNTGQLAVINEYWSEIANATNKDQLRLLHQDLTKNQVKPLGKNNVDELCRWCAWNAEVLP
jgi:hypothetical protein